jgi:hypothetical protein
MMPRNLGTRGYQFHQILQSNIWTQTQMGVSSFCTTLNVNRAVPFIPSRAGTLNGVAINVTTGGASSNVIRLGVYNHDYSTGLPGTLLADLGTVSGVGTGIKTLTSLTTAIDNKIYWLTAVTQVGTACQMRAATGGNHLVGQSAGTPTDTLPGCYETAATVTGALPGTFTVSTQGLAAPCIFVRVT